MSRTTRWMSDHHEEHLVDVIGGKRQPGSGNQFNGQMDVRNHPNEAHAIAVDGKSTMGKSITITTEMVEKAIEQSHDLIPAIGLRWYPDETGRNTTDWIAIPTQYFEDILADARSCYEEPEVDE